jgi:hypothetical protein
VEQFEQGRILGEFIEGLERELGGISAQKA